MREKTLGLPMFRNWKRQSPLLVLFAVFFMVGIFGEPAFSRWKESFILKNNQRLSEEKEVGVSLEFETVEKGFFSGITEQKKLIIKTRDQWKNLWNKHTSIRLPPSEVPAIDFTKNMIIVVFMGQKPTGGFAIEITKIKKYKDEIVTSFAEGRPPSDALVTQVLIQPYHIVKVKRSNLPVRFKKIEGRENEK